MSWADDYNVGFWIVKFYGSIHRSCDESADKDHTVVVDVGDGGPSLVIEAIKEVHDEFAVFKSMKRVKIIERIKE